MLVICISHTIQQLWRVETERSGVCIYTNDMIEISMPEMRRNDDLAR